MFSNHFKRFYTLFFFLFYILGNLPSFSVKSQELQDGFDLVTTKVYSTPRPSRQEAFKALKAHCEEVIDYHRDMLKMFKEKEERYRPLITRGVGTPQLDLFLKSVLNVNVKGTPPTCVLTNFILVHGNSLNFWSCCLATLTNTPQELGDGRLYKPTDFLGEPTHQNTVGNFFALQNEFDIMKSAINRDSGDLSKTAPENVSLVQVRLDQLWSIRHAQSLMIPWLATDEEIQKKQEEKQKLQEEVQKIREEIQKIREEPTKQAEAEAQEKKRLKNQKQKKKKKLKKVLGSTDQTEEPQKEDAKLADQKKEDPPQKKEEGMKEESNETRVDAQAQVAVSAPLEQTATIQETTIQQTVAPSKPKKKRKPKKKLQSHSQTQEIPSIDQKKDVSPQETQTKAKEDPDFD
jgi:hypothetical protein